MKKRTWRNILLVALCVLLSTSAITLIGRWTNGSFDIAHQLKGDRNDKNLITVEQYSLKSRNETSGLKVNVDDDGVIKIKGQASKTEDVTYLIASVALKAGTYTVGGYKSNSSKAGIRVLVGDVYHWAGVDNDTNGATFTLTADTTVQVQLFIAKETNFVFAETFKPTLALGSTEIDFYK